MSAESEETTVWNIGAKDVCIHYNVLQMPLNLLANYLALTLPPDIRTFCLQQLATYNIVTTDWACD